MRKRKRDPKWWLILALVNVLLMEYPTWLYFQADDDAARVMAALVLGGVAFVLAIGDFVTIILARDQVAETKGKYITRKPTARPREISLGTVREFERDQAVLNQQARKSAASESSPIAAHSSTHGQMGYVTGVALVS